MQTALNLDPPITSDPVPSVAFQLTEYFKRGVAIDTRVIRTLFENATGCSDAAAGWSMRDAYDALELAQVLFLLDPACPIDLSSLTAGLASLQSLSERLPTQTYRSEDQVALQQFSTPLPLAWIASAVAALRPADYILEPSAGTGLLAWTAARIGCRLALNELDHRRRACLETAFPAATATSHDAEVIDDLLPASIIPDVVLMNPPFARSHGRGVDPHAATRHMTAAWKRLRSGGRLVAIMPDGFSATRWTESRVSEATIRLDARVAAGLYAKQGTGVAVRLIVIDKLSDTVPPVFLDAAALSDLVGTAGALSARPAPTPPTIPTPRPRLSLFRAPLVSPPLPSPCRASSAPSGAIEPIDMLVLDEPAAVEDQVGIYLPWRPSRLQFPGACDHPTALVESIAMGSVAAPKPSYRPLLPVHLVTEGLLSAAQLETLVYAGDAFERDVSGRFLPADEGCTLTPVDDDGAVYARGFFLGDGTGAGKGRQIAGIILDQWLRGRRRHIWISKNETLLEDARRDWSALGGLALDVQPLSQWKLGTVIGLDAGILFVTYPTLRSGRDDTTRLKQIIGWAGGDFDGVIAFDEAHAMANAAGGEGSRGKVRGSEQGIAGLRLQNLLPHARVLYASATGASDVANLSYATRLGLWGPDTAFATREQFVAAIRKGGIAAMELVARDLKALGLYTARALSFAGVEYELLEHALTVQQIGIYDAYADAWAIIHRNLNAVLEETRVIDSASGATLNANAKSAALSRFEGTKQRFFAQLLLSMKLPSLIPAIETNLGESEAVVVQLVSTAEAMLDRRLADLEPHEREMLDIDLSPREYVIDYLTTAFPTRQMKVFTDAEGTIRSEPMSDDDGRPVHCRSAIEARDTLIEQLCALPPIATALDALIERFGTDAVAEVTGRTRRLVIGNDGRQRIEKRTLRSNLVETQAFMDGGKRLLVFSDAGGTGRSYHASLDAMNRARRIHYLLEPGWRADAAIQGLGRTHRTRQASAPLFRPVTTDVRGERRFISTIARRLDALGALTRGQRQTGGQNLFDPADNLESAYAKSALLTWYRLLFDGKLRSATLGDFQERTGLRLESEDGGLRKDLPPIQRWLNRLLALPIALQNAIFDEYLALIETRVAAAREAGTLDIGVETLLVESFEILRWLKIDARTYYEGGVPVRIAGIVADVTDKRVMEEQLRQAQKMEAVGQLTGGIAHDFNNLLMIIGGSLDLLAKRIPADEKTERIFGAARQGVARGALLNQQLLAFSRRQDLRAEVVCIDDHIPTFEHLLERAAGEMITIDIQRAPKPWFCRTDPHQLETAILNLAINARDAMPNGGTLTLATSNREVSDQAAAAWGASGGEYVVLSVADNGSGMPPEVATRVFEPFFTTKEVGKGTGLGLSQVYGFAKQSGGFVTIDSEERNGTTVMVHLPRTHQPKSQVTAIETSVAASKEGHGAILVVEDDPDVRATTSGMLRELGYVVREVGTGREALADIEKGMPVDLVFSDVIMPDGMSGIELARELGARRPDLPILLTSGYTAQRVIPEELAKDLMLLRKPYALPELSEAVRSAMNICKKGACG